MAKVNQVKYVLPREAFDPVVVKQTGNSTAVLYMSFNSKVLTPSQITDYLNRVVQPRLQTIDGVANAQILGGQTFAMRVWLNPDRMAARGVTPSDVSAALAANNFTTAAGQIKGDFVQTSINAETSLNSARAFGQLVVAAHGDAMIRLGDIADIELGPESVDSSSTFDGLKAVFIGIYPDTDGEPAQCDRRGPQGLSGTSSRSFPSALTPRSPMTRRSSSGLRSGRSRRRLAKRRSLSSW